MSPGRLFRNRALRTLGLTLSVGLMLVIAGVSTSTATPPPGAEEFVASLVKDINTDTNGSFPQSFVSPNPPKEGVGLAS